MIPHENSVSLSVANTCSLRRFIRFNSDKNVLRVKVIAKCMYSMGRPYSKCASTLNLALSTLFLP